MKIACVQINSGTNISANVEKIDGLVKEAAGKGAQLVTLPENCFQMYEPHGERTLFEQDAHQGVMAAKEMARAYKVWLLVGSVAVKIDDSGKAVNRSLLFDDMGKVVAVYDKVHLFDVDLLRGEKYRESDRMLPGKKMVLADTPWGKLGMTVCYDVRFPQLYRALAKAGADIIAVPSAFTLTTGVAHWHVLLRARAIENGCFIIAPAQTGLHAGGRETYGHSLIVDPWGKVLTDAGVHEGVIVTDIDISAVARIRNSLPSLHHDREFKS